MTLVTSLTDIAHLATEKTAENEAFIQFIKQQPSAQTDQQVQLLNHQIAPQIDCLTCGNCCKSLMINVTENEADAVSTHLQTTRTQFDADYLEKGMHGLMVMNAIPCTFLNNHNNECAIYSCRFEGCREFPALHLPDFSKRLFTTFMHYNRCPIVYNVVEALKEATAFEG